MAEKWSLGIAGSFGGGVAGRVFDARTRSGAAVVLKLGFPHDEAIWEAVGLEAMGEGLAPLVIEQDVEEWALLLERIRPGAPLSTSELSVDEALRVGGGLLARVNGRESPHGLPTLAEVARGYAERARDGLGAHRDILDELAVGTLVDGALAILDAAEPEPGDRLLHGDFNPGNILSRGALDWAVIDPKPVVGDPAWDLWPLITQVGGARAGDLSTTELARRTSVAAAAASIDEARAARWAFARTGLNICWSLEDADTVTAAAEARALARWAEIAGVGRGVRRER